MSTLKNKTFITIGFPHPPGAGGPGSFQVRFEKKLKSRGYDITYAGSTKKPDLIFVVGGTKRVFWLIRNKWRKVWIIYRLDGISWLHRKKNIGLKKFFIVELGIIIGKIIHAFIADSIVYQSKFVENWWNRSGFRKRKNTSVIYNGVKIPEKRDFKNISNKITLVGLEGNIDYSPCAVRLVKEIALKLKNQLRFELYGNFEFPRNKDNLNADIHYHGFIPQEMVPEVMNGAIYLSLDINPACPNTVTEALSCGAPVVAFDTGALKELVPSDAGIIVPYGSDPWKLAYPDVNALVDAILKVKDNYSFYSLNARQVAIERFSIEDMTEKYLSIINELTGSGR